MLALVGVLLLFLVAGRLKTSLLYALPVDESQRVNWIELPEFGIVKSQYFQEGDDRLLELYRAQETESSYFMGLYDAELFRSGETAPQPSEPLSWTQKIRRFIAAIFWGERWDSGVAQVLEDDLTSPLEEVNPEPVEVVDEPSGEESITEEPVSEELESIDPSEDEDPISEASVSEGEQSFSTDAASSETEVVEELESGESALDEGLSSSTDSQEGENIEIAPAVSTEPSEVSPEEVLSEEPPQVTFEERLRTLETEVLNVSEEDVLSRRREVLQATPDVLVRLGKDFSLDVDAFSPESDFHLRFQAEEGYGSWFRQGMVHFQPEENNLVVSYHYDQENRVLKEWMVFLSAPSESFQFHRTLVDPTSYQVRRLIGGEYVISTTELGDDRAFILSRPRVIRESITDLQAPVETYYNSGTFTMVFEGDVEQQYPLLVEREWRMPSLEELEELQAMDTTALERIKNQRQLDLLQSIPFSYESNLGQYGQEVLFSGFKHHASYFLKKNEIVGQWFIPYEDQGRNPLNIDVVSNGESSIDDQGSQTGAFGYGYGYESDDFIENEDRSIVCRETRPLLTRLLRENDKRYVFGTLRQLFVQVSDSVEVVSSDIDRITNHLIRGNTFSQWFSGVESTPQVMYENLYEGIDLIVGADDIGLTQTYVFHEGAERSALVWRYRGNEEVSLMKNGDLVVDLGVCEVGFEKPYAVYLDESRELLNAKYTMAGRRGISFEVNSPEDGRDFIIYIKISEQRTNCLQNPVYEEDITIVPLFDETYYLAGYTSAPFSTPSISDEYQCLEGKSFDPEIRLVDFSTRKTLFKTVFGGSQRDTIESLVLDISGVGLDGDASLEVFVDDVLREDRSANETENLANSLDLVLSQPKIFLTVSGQTLSEDFPGLAYMMDDADVRSAAFEFKLDENGLISINDESLLVLAQPRVVPENILNPEVLEADGDLENAGQSEVETVTEISEVGELRGAAELPPEESLGVVELGPAGSADVELLPEGEVENDAFVPPSFEPEVPVELEVDRSEIFEEVLQELFGENIGEYRLSFVTLSDDLVEIRFMDTQSNQLVFSFVIDLSVLEESLIQPPNESSSDLQSFWKNFFYRQVFAQAMVEGAQAVDAEQRAELIEEIRQGLVRVRLDEAIPRLESSEGKVFSRTGTGSEFIVENVLYLSNTNDGAGVYICADDQVASVEDVNDDCESRLVFSRDDIRYEVRKNGFFVQLVSAEGEVLADDFETATQYRVAGPGQLGVGIFGFQNDEWTTLEPFQ
ncbi:MAG: hypothetical protein AB7J40_05170, partial [Candidatus Altimarinota bacterium]